MSSVIAVGVDLPRRQRLDQIDTRLETSVSSQLKKPVKVIGHDDKRQCLQMPVLVLELQRLNQESSVNEIREDIDAGVGAGRNVVDAVTFGVSAFAERPVTVYGFRDRRHGDDHGLD
jgi:hypothetical protein